MRRSVVRAASALVALALWPGCAAEAPLPAPPPAPSGLTGTDIALVLDVERVLAEARATAAGELAERARRLRDGEQLPGTFLPTPLPAAAAAAVAGHDPEAYVRARARIEEIAELGRLRAERDAAARFRAVHLESLKRQREAALSDGERANLEAILAEVEEGARRAAAEDARVYSPEVEREIELVTRHAAELGVAIAAAPAAAGTAGR